MWINQAQVDMVRCPVCRAELCEPREVRPVAELEGKDGGPTGEKSSDQVNGSSMQGGVSLINAPDENRAANGEEMDLD